MRIIRHIPDEVWREVKWFGHDLWLAARGGQFGAVAGEIFRFRFEKMLGTVKGILDSRSIDSPLRRAEMFYQKGFPAVVIRGPRRAELEERAVPSLSPGNILVRVAYVGVCATDLEILDGTLGYFKSGMASYPIVPGHETSGTVVSLGPRATSLSAGDRVVVEPIQGCGECAACAQDAAIRCRERREVGVMGQDGAYAAYLVTRARYAHKIPDGVSLAHSAITEPLAVVIKALRKLEASLPHGGTRRCGVVGAGMIGQLAARVLHLRGHEVTVFDRDTNRLSLLGGRIMVSTELKDLGRFDWIIEATGDQTALTTALQNSATGATLLLLGLPYATHNFSFESVVGFDRTVIGSVGSGAADFDEALATLPSLDLSRLIGATYPLEKFENAWTAVRAHKHVKVMLKVDANAD
jgi:2-desacetyl-2-hydroxyethyl bacteriochlorophyllide A dehydrogenase